MRHAQRALLLLRHLCFVILSTFVIRPSSFPPRSLIMWKLSFRRTLLPQETIHELSALRRGHSSGSRVLPRLRRAIGRYSGRGGRRVFTDKGRATSAQGGPSSRCPRYSRAGIVARRLF